MRYMNNSRRVNSITYGALLTALLGVVLFLNRQLAGAFDLYLFWVLPLPVIIYILKFGVSQSFVLGISMLLMSFIIAAPTTVFYVAGSVIAGIVYGYGMKKHWSATALIVSVIVVSLIMMFFSVFVFAGVFGYNIQDEVIWYRKTMTEVFNQMGQGNNSQVQSALASLLTDNVLLTIIITSEVLASIMEGILVHLLSYAILKKLKMELPPMKPIAEITAPQWIKVFVFTVFSALLLSSITGVSQYNTIIILGLSLVFAICMFYGYLLIMVYLSWRIPGKKARSMAVMLVVMIAFILPPLMYMVGLLDIYTNIRQRIIEEIKKNGTSQRQN